MNIDSIAEVFVIFGHALACQLYVQVVFGFIISPYECAFSLVSLYCSSTVSSHFHPTNHIKCYHVSVMKTPVPDSACICNRNIIAIENVVV